MSGFSGSKYCWMNGEVIETEKALVSAMEPIYYGIFEGIRAYVEDDILGEGDLNIFRWKAHVDRLFRSAAVTALDIAYSKDELLEGTRASIKANGFKKTTYIQPRVWPKAGAMRKRALGTDFHVVIPTSFYDTGLRKEVLSKERRFMVSSWRRIASDALPPQVKAWGNYANSGLARREALRLGFDDAILLDNRGFVSEATGACLMTVHEGRVVTPPVTASILPSITRDAFIKFISEDLGIPVDVRDIARVELYASDEAFLCGTGAEVQPITSVDDIKLGETYPGPLTMEIAKYYSEILAGNVSKRRDWLTPV